MVKNNVTRIHHKLIFYNQAFFAAYVKNVRKTLDLFREEYYLSRSKPEENHPNFGEWQEAMERVYGKADVIVAKQRHGAIGTVTLQFYGEQTRFDDLAEAERLPARFG
jgi:DnaB-like helicase C terminal domain